MFVLAAPASSWLNSTFKLRILRAHHDCPHSSEKKEQNSVGASRIKSGHRRRKAAATRNRKLVFPNKHNQFNNSFLLLLLFPSFPSPPDEVDGGKEGESAQKLLGLATQAKTGGGGALISEADSINCVLSSFSVLLFCQMAADTTTVGREMIFFALPFRASEGESRKATFVPNVIPFPNKN